MTRRKHSARVSAAGVTHTRLAIEDVLGWIFREQPTEDYGIDAHTEVVDGEDVLGRLLALQIKGGSSWFAEPGPGGWWFRPIPDHVRYWKSHSLPVVVVLYEPVAEVCYWELVNSNTLVATSTGGWKVLVPEAQTLDEDAKGPLRDAAQGDPYELRLRELRLAKPWMEMLASGTRLVVDFDEWINKSSGRGTISIGIDCEDGHDPEKLVEWHFAVGPTSYAEAVPRLFSWADSAVHSTTYEMADDHSYEDGADPGGIRPYANSAGEVDHYRIELTLNELGMAYLVVDQFAQRGPQQLTG